MRRKPPKSIRGMKGLKEISLSPLSECAGVYFLCLGDEVVYVGRSMSIQRRIGGLLNERWNGLKFDRAYCIAMPPKKILPTWTELRKNLVRPHFESLSN